MLISVDSKCFKQYKGSPICWLVFRTTGKFYILENQREPKLKINLIHYENKDDISIDNFNIYITVKGSSVT